MSAKGFHSIHELSQALGYAHSEKLQRLIRHPGNNPSFRIVSDLANKFEDVNANWLLTGKGEPFESMPISENQMVQEDASAYETAPRIYVLDARAFSAWPAQSGSDYFKRFPSFTMAAIIHRSGDYIMVPVADDAMEPTLSPGSWIVCRRITADQAVNRKIYVMLHRGPTGGPRICRASFTNDKKIILESDNKAYPSRQLLLKDAILIFIMEYYFTAHFGAQNEDVTKSLDLLRKDLDKIKKDIRKKK